MLLCLASVSASHYSSYNYAASATEYAAYSSYAPATDYQYAPSSYYYSGSEYQPSDYSSVYASEYYYTPKAYDKYSESYSSYADTMIAPQSNKLSILAPLAVAAIFLGATKPKL